MKSKDPGPLSFLLHTSPNTLGTLATVEDGMGGKGREFSTAQV
jgi:hypothetical protein